MACVVRKKNVADSTWNGLAGGESIATCVTVADLHEN